MDAVRNCTFVRYLFSMFVFDDGILMPSGCNEICSRCIEPTLPRPPAARGLHRCKQRFESTEISDTDGAFLGSVIYQTTRRHTTYDSHRLRDLKSGRHYHASILVVTGRRQHGVIASGMTSPSGSSSYCPSTQQDLDNAMVTPTRTCRSPCAKALPTVLHKSGKLRIM